MLKKTALFLMDGFPKHMKTGNKNYFAPLKGFEHYFLYSVKQLIQSSLILFIGFLENKMWHSYFSKAVHNPFLQDASRAKTVKNSAMNLMCGKIDNLGIITLIEYKFPGIVSAYRSSVVGLGH